MPGLIRTCALQQLALASDTAPVPARYPPAGLLLVIAAFLVLALPFVVRAEFANPQGVAVIIGNADYEHRDVPDVTFAHRDADAFRRYVVDILGYDPENVVDLRDASRRELFDALGTKSDPRSLLWSYLDPVGGSDVVVFYSGHGVPGVNDGRGYLLPVDADPKAAEDDGYPIDLLYRNVGGLEEARSVRVYLDACFSGGSNEGGLIRNASPVYVEATLPEGVGDKVTSLTAASGKQVASWDENARHGLFTHHLLNALYGRGDADEDGEVTAAEVKAYLDRHMTRAARRQHRRIQEASLIGVKDAVLAAAAGGGAFPARPGSDAAGTDSPDPATAAVREEVAVAGGGEEPPPPVGPPESAEKALALTHAQRVLVQRGLASLGEEVGRADGIFGERTRAGISSLQKKKGLPETGYLTGELASSLQALGNESKPKWPPKKKFRDCPECPEMVVVPAGSFDMGSPSREDGHSADEGPVHRVTISKPLAVGIYEVTFREWEACRRAGGCSHSPDDRRWGRGDRPVINVSWEDAQQYVRWLSRETGEEYRLPSESEWEYAARGGTTEPFHFGSTISAQQANYDANFVYGTGRKGRYRKRTVPVGTFPSNAFGLHDVHGNVFEWVEDCWHADYQRAPSDGSAWTRGDDCGRRVWRGGSWNDVPGNLRSANRDRITLGNRLDYIGLRVARTLD